MAQTPQKPQPQVQDPDNVPETLCDGHFNLLFSGRLATLTFTHLRPEVAQMFGGTVNQTAIVRARIVLTVQNLLALRDFLHNKVQVSETSQGPAPAPATGGSPTKH